MTNPATHAALDKARRDLEQLLTTAANQPRTDEQITHVADQYLASLRDNGWHHVSEHHAPPEPPTNPDPPSEAYREARAKLAMHVAGRAEIEEMTSDG